MAYALTYNNLLALIPTYLERTDSAVIDSIPIFVVLAQRRISKDTKSLGLETYLQGSFVEGQSVIQKPTFWLNTLSWQYGSGTDFNTSTPLEMRLYEFNRFYWPDPTQLDPPKYYSDYDYNHWLVTPTPDQNYPFEIAFLGLATTIDETQQTNWVTDFAPELLIYGSLLEAQILLKNDERTTYFMNLYQNALQSLMRESKERLSDRTQDGGKG